MEYKYPLYFKFIDEQHYNGVDTFVMRFDGLKEGQCILHLANYGHKDTHRELGSLSNMLTSHDTTESWEPFDYVNYDPETYIDDPIEQFFKLVGGDNGET